MLWNECAVNEMNVKSSGLQKPNGQNFLHDIFLVAERNNAAYFLKITWFLTFFCPQGPHMEIFQGLTQDSDLRKKDSKQLLPLYKKFLFTEKKKTYESGVTYIKPLLQQYMSSYDKGVMLHL